MKETEDRQDEIVQTDGPRYGAASLAVGLLGFLLTYAIGLDNLAIPVKFLVPPIVAVTGLGLGRFALIRKVRPRAWAILGIVVNSLALVWSCGLLFAVMTLK